MFNNPIEEVKERYINEYNRLSEIIMKTYPKRLKELREGAEFAYGMKQVEVAEILNSHPDVNIKRSMYSRLESGDVTPPMKVFLAVMALYGVTIGEATGLETLRASRSLIDNTKKYQQNSLLEMSQKLKEVADFLNKEAKVMELKSRTTDEKGLD